MKKQGSPKVQRKKEVIEKGGVKLTDRENAVLEFVEKHGRCTSVHLAFHFGKKERRSHCGYISLLKRMEKKGLLREVEYLPHQRNFVLKEPNPRFSRG